MAHKMHLWISEKYNRLRNGFPKLLNADCITTCIKLTTPDGEFLVELHLLIRSDTIDFSLYLILYSVCISDTLGFSFS